MDPLKLQITNHNYQLFLPMLKSTLLEATQAAADEMRRFIDLEFKISNKEGINNLVTEVDHASEKAIIDVIKKRTTPTTTS